MSKQGQRSMKTAIKKVLGIWLDLVLKVKYSEILILKAIFLSKISQIFRKKISLKKTKMGDQFLSIPYFDNFIFNVLYFLKLRPNFDILYQIKPNC